jgi:hypothetical protein
MGYRRPVAVPEYKICFVDKIEAALIRCICNTE